MDFKIDKAMKYMEKALKKWDNLFFEYDVIRGNGVSATASNVSLRNHDDDISVVIQLGYSGLCEFRVVFDLIEKTADVLNLINEFNRQDFFFRAYVRNDGYLELSHPMICYGDESIIRDYSEEFLSRTADLADSEILLELTARTHS